MKKLITNAMSKKLSRNEMKTISGGRFAIDGDCISCTCNGVDYGCVSSVQECWNKC
ncbi:bacteriocin-like protein [Ascidiimonas sp. W6]|uniref:bacteriocin-like protein n=1 Tax=Ascidiimonas meishanensis TaxID=3128903 RepID=UPI0030ECF296